MGSQILSDVESAWWDPGEGDVVHLETESGKKMKVSRDRFDLSSATLENADVTINSLDGGGKEVFVEFEDPVECMKKGKRLVCGGD